MRISIILTGLLAAMVTVTASAENVSGNNQDDVDEEMLVIEKKPEAVSVPQSFGSSRIRNWYVIDNKTLIIEAVGQRKYKATLMNPCHGLRFTDSIGFSTGGPWELDKWTTIHLPDGQRCYIKDLVHYEEPIGQEE